MFKFLGVTTRKWFDAEQLHLIKYRGFGVKGMKWDVSEAFREKSLQQNGITLKMHV